MVTIKRILLTTGELLAVLLVLSLLAGQILGQPVLLAFVETDSMSPALDPGDGFVAVPDALAGSVEHGDVVVYRAEVVQGGGLVTHRVVGSNDRGFVTRGDANPFTDQADGEPPVTRHQVVAEALQLRGHLIVIPELGTAVEAIQSVLSVVQRRLAMLLGTRTVLGVQGLAYLFFGASVAVYVVGEWRRGGRTDQQRTDSRDTGLDTRLVMAAFTGLLVLGATAGMVVPAGTEQYNVVSAEFDSDSPTVIPHGQSTDVAYPVANGGLVPTVSFLEARSDGIDVSSRRVYAPPRTTREVRVTLTAPAESGAYRRYLHEHRYLAVLPVPVIHGLYTLHPWTPLLVIDALLAIPFYLVGIRLLGSGRVRRRSRSRTRSTAGRLHSLLGRNR